VIRRNADQEAARGKGIFERFYDPEGERFGTPTYPFHYAPKGMLTRRQLRERGLAPGGHDPEAQIIWPHKGRRRKAYLYDEAKAVPKRIATPAQLLAVEKALRARKTCPSCPPETAVKDYCIPRSLGECWECHEGAVRGSAGKEAGQERQIEDYEAEAC
jgi:hypothetical protein